MVRMTEEQEKNLIQKNTCHKCGNIHFTSVAKGKVTVRCRKCLASMN